MARPGVVVQTQSSPPPRSAPTDSGVAFVAGLCDQGPVNRPIQVSSLSDFVSKCGGRVTYSILYDVMDAYFHEGGDSAYIARVVGPAPVIASRNLLDNVAGTSLVVKALGPGTYGNNLSVAVLAPLVAGYRLQVTFNGTIVETSPDLATQQDAVNWAAANSQYVTVTIGGSALVPQAAAAAALAGGADDRGNIVDGNWLTALNLFTYDLGPGQVLAPGRTSDVGHQQLADHAKNFNRTALLDLVDTPTKATLETAATNAKTTGSGQYAAPFTPWLIIPGVTGASGSYRTIPPSGSVAGAMARVDASDNPNTPAAGDKGALRYAIGLTQPAFVDADRTELNTFGVNLIRNMGGLVEVYGYRSLADPVNNPQWLDLSNVRYLMWLSARCEAVGQQFLFDPIDGQGHTIADYGAALSALCQRDWNAGMIYGATAAEAFNVDVSNNINTPQTIASNQLLATVAVRPDPFAELVTITIVNVPITQAVS